MSHKLINQTGIINLPYVLSIVSTPKFISLSIYVKLPDGPTTLLDVIAVAIENTSCSAIMEVYLTAEDKWGIDFIKYQPEILKHND